MTQETLTQETMQQTSINGLGFLNSIFNWIDRHETLTNIIILIEIAAIVWAVINYNFTTNI